MSASLSRQSRTLIFGGVLCLVLAVLSFTLRVPYLVESPGPTYNTLGQKDGQDIVAIDGRTASRTTGHLNMMTVLSDTDKTTIVGAIEGWLRHDEVVVPYDAVYPPGTTKQQQATVNEQDFAGSQDNATLAAACELGYPKGFGVASVAADSPNRAVLHSGDELVSVDGTKIADDKGLRAVLTKHKAGDRLSVVIARAGKPSTISVVLAPPAEGGTTPRLGITVSNGCLMPFDVTLTLSGVGGPSAGLMFALGIIDKVGDHDLTHGRFIAGTGTIDPSGAVGEIGGISLKMIAARRAGATIFLAPASNCSAVRGNIPSGLDVVKVSSLHEAITSLDALANNQPVAHC